jgi:hypothetical protein
VSGFDRISTFITRAPVESAHDLVLFVAIVTAVGFRRLFHIGHPDHLAVKWCLNANGQLFALRFWHADPASPALSSADAG